MVRGVEPASFNLGLLDAVTGQLLDLLDLHAASRMSQLAEIVLTPRPSDQHR
jgi:hypothetical protein